MISRGKIPFVRLTLPLMAGIALGKSSLPISELIILTYSILLGLTLLVILFYKKLNLYKVQWLPGLLVHLVILTIGQQLTILNDPRSSNDYFAKHPHDALVVSVGTEPKITKGVIRFEGNIEQVFLEKRNKPTTGKLLVAIKADSVASFSYGDLLLLPSSATEIQPPLNPGEFDYRNFLANKQIYHQIFLDAAKVQKLKVGKGNAVISYALAFRKDLVQHFNAHIKDREAASIASTLILGYRADLSDEVIEAYSKTGTMHVLSVSGMHVGLVFLILNLLLKGLDRKKTLKFIKPALIIPLIWYYALITGFSPSVSRAALMLSFFVLGKSLNRSQNSYNLVAVSAFFLLIYNPYYLFDVGFQLSYLAVLGLIYIYPIIYHLTYLKNWLLDQIWSYCALSTAAQLATFTLSVYYFHQFPVYFLVSNLFIVVPVTLIMYVGFVFLLIPLPIVSSTLGLALDFLIRFVNSGLYLIETAPFSTIEDIWFSEPELLLLTIMVLCGITAFQIRSKPMLLASLMSLLLFLVLFNFTHLDAEKKKELLVYSLRKNIGLGFIEGKQAVIISDLDRSDKTFSYSIKPWVVSNGVDALEILHPSASNSSIRRKNFYQFSSYRILQWDRTFNYKKFSYPVFADAVLLTGNPNIRIAELLQMVKCRTILLNGDNSYYKMERWQAEADSLGIELHNLKVQGAYKVKL